MAKLILSMDGLVLKEIVLKKERLSIGRKPHNDVQIDNLAVSGEHARIVTILDDSFLEDMDSTNGTLVNGRPVKKHRLKHNDVIELGKYKLKYLNDPEEEGNEGSFDPGISVQAPVQAPVPVAKIHVLTGKNAGRMLSLVKPVTSLGRPGVQVALIARDAVGQYSLTHMEGAQPPLLNNQSLGFKAQALKDRDVIEVQGVKMEFLSS